MAGKPMKTTCQDNLKSPSSLLLPFVLALAGLWLVLPASAATASYSISFAPGSTAFDNHFDRAGGNTVTALFPSPPLSGIQIYKWNGSGFVLNNYDADLGWDDPNMTINPGEGAFLHTSSSFTNLFFGAPHTPTLPVP